MAGVAADELALTANNNRPFEPFRLLAKQRRNILNFLFYLIEHEISEFRMESVVVRSFLLLIFNKLRKNLVEYGVEYPML